MSANLILLPRKEFELILSDGTVVKGQFGTWALAQFGRKKKLGLSQIFSIFYKPAVDDEGNVANVAEPQMFDLIEFVLCAIEYKERQSGVAPNFNELKFAQWIDDYTHDTGNSGVMLTLFNHASAEEKETEEKKNQREIASNTTGPIYNE